MRETPLTPEQRTFAERHHNLVYTFLHRNHLPESEFYDVVIFGYLKGVRDYLSRTDLQKYSFATIGWKAMARSLSSHYRYQRRQKRNGTTISLDTTVFEDGLILEERISSPDNLMQQLETRLLFHELAKHLSRQQMETVQLKHEGYYIWEIARKQKVPIQHVLEQLGKIHEILLEINRE